MPDEGDFAFEFGVALAEEGVDPVAFLEDGHDDVLAVCG